MPSKKQYAFNFRDGLKPIEVGSIVYVKGPNRRDRFYDSKIKKIGRELIHLDCGRSFYFDGSERSDFSYCSIWSSEQAFSESVLADRTLMEIGELIRNFGNRKNIKLEDALKIKAILETALNS